MGHGVFGLKFRESWLFPFSAIIVTGGRNKEGDVLSVELLLADGTLWCNLPSLPEALSSHTQSGLEACGGLPRGDSCITLTKGQWTTSHVLAQNRSSLSSWLSAQHGTILIGGDFDSSKNSYCCYACKYKDIHFNLWKTNIWKFILYPINL